MLNKIRTVLTVLGGTVILGCSQTPACDEPSAVDSVKSQLSQRLMSFVGAKRLIVVTALAPTDKGIDPTSHVRLCTGIASSEVGAPTVVYTITRSSDGKSVVQISNIEPDQALRDAVAASVLANSPEHLLGLDEGNLGQLALGMEEYAIDHSGKYPRSFDELIKSNQGVYLKQVPAVPGSGGRYTLVVPPADKRMGGYEILDDGSIGANTTLRKIDGDF